MPVDEKETVERWQKRINAAKKVKEQWEKDYEVPRCYQYWRGNQLSNPFDEYGDRRIQVNRIHADVKSNLPSLYYYNPFGRVTAAPEKANDAGETVDDKAQLLQDTVNSIIREPETSFRPNTFLALKESQWAFGCVEVGHSAEFTDNPLEDKPPLKEKKDTKIEGEEESSEMMGMGDQAMPPDDQMPMMTEQPDQALAGLEQVPKSEQFYVKHIAAKQLLCSVSDLALLEANDWIGYYEDYNLEDVKRSGSYSNTADLKPFGVTDEAKSDADVKAAQGDRARLWKIWDLRTKERLVIAEGNDVMLSRRPFKRLPLKLLFFDVDPNHFYPIPPIYSQLGSQDEYNDSREYLRLVRKGTVPRYTYDADAMDAGDMKKLESGDIGIYVPRKGGTVDPILPINQPTFSENAIRTLTLAEKEIEDVQGNTGNPQVSETKTATQAVIKNTREQVQDSFDRSIVADWLGSIMEEILLLATEKMLLDRWIRINVDPDSQMAMAEAVKVVVQVQQITRDKLMDAQNGIRWSLKVDVESLSPVSEQEKAQQWMQGLQLISNDATAPILALSPELLKRTLELLGMKSSRDQELIGQALIKVTQLKMAMAAAQAGAPGQPPGMSSQPGQPPQMTPRGPAGNPPAPPQRTHPGAPTQQQPPRPM